MLKSSFPARNAAVVMIILLIATSPLTTHSSAAGEIGKFVRSVGKATGIEVIEKAGEEADRAWDKAKEDIPIIADVQHATTDQLRDSGRWARENPEEALAIAAVVAVGWAACVDGCTFIAGVVLDGAAAGGMSGIVPIAVVELSEEKDDGTKVIPVVADSAPAGSPTPSSLPSGSGESTEALSGDVVPVASGESVTEQGLPELPDSKVPGYVERGLQSQYPRYIALSDSISNKVVVVYRTLDQRLGEALNSFAPPVYPALVRQPNVGDSAGGTFLSRRSDMGNSAEALVAKDALAPNARRVHGGTDFLSIPGQPVIASMTGVVDKVNPWITTKSGLKGVRVVSGDGTVGRTLYFEPDATLKPGDAVVAGETRLGVAVDISKVYPGVPNHVHVDFTDYSGRRFDPWTNSFLDPLP